MRVKPVQQVNAIPEQRQRSEDKKDVQGEAGAHARQIALRGSRETVALSTVTAIKDPVVTASKVIEISEMYLEWLNGKNSTIKHS